MLRLVYEFHYSTKHVFQLYLFANELLLQPLLNALEICFFMDLGMLWESKYDLNIFNTTIKDNRHYNPKEKENMVFVGPIQRTLDGFLSIIDFLQ